MTQTYARSKVSSVLRRIGQLLVLLPLIAAIGGHWAILQSIAWTSMLADNLREGTVTEAVNRTFDGEHPCSMCKQIAEGKKSEKKSDALNLKVTKLEFATAQIGFVFTAPATFQPFSVLHSTAESYAEAPPVPPPRFLTV